MALGNIVSGVLRFAVALPVHDLHLQIYASKEQGQAIDASLIRPYLSALPSAFPEERIKDVTKEIVDLL